MGSKLTQLKKLSKNLKKKHPEKIRDIILFGSSVRGKENPRDIDIAIVFNDQIDKSIEYELKKDFPKDVSIISKTSKNIFDFSFDAREGILFEGYSLIDSETIASKYGFASLGLFVYETSKLSNTIKTRFYYALNGRGSAQGEVNAFEGIKLSDNILAVPLQKIEKAKEFLDFWKIEYKYIPILVPERISNIIHKLY